MSDEQRKDEETEVEGHVRRGGHHSGMNEEPKDETEDEVEAHVRHQSPRKTAPRKI